MAKDTSLGFNIFGRDVSASDALKKVARTAKQTGDDFDVVGKNLGGFTGSISKSFLGMGAAIGGAFAVGNIVSSFTQYMTDAAGAAIEDEKSMVALKVAMENVGLASKNASAEDFVRSLSLATGEVDDNLRPALQRLITATGDAEESQRLLALSLDIATATGKGTVEVAQALGKAANGQVSALTRLGVPLDANIVKSKDFGAAVDVLSEKFGGQAAAAAETYGGKLKIVQTAAGEAQETIGYALLAALDSASESLGGTGGLVQMLTDAGDTTANFIAGVSAGIQPILDFAAAMSTLMGSADQGAFANLVDMAKFIPGFSGVAAAYDLVAGAGAEVTAEQKRMNDSLRASEALYAGLAESTDPATKGLRDMEAAEQAAADAADDLKSAFDTLMGSLSTQDRMDAYRLSLLSIKDSIDDTSRSLGNNSVEGLKNRDVIRQVFADAEQATTAWAEQTGATTEEAQRKFAGMTANIRNTLVTQGFKPEDIDHFLGGLGLWTGQTQALASGLSQGDAAAAMRMTGQAFASKTAAGFADSASPGGAAYEAMGARMTALAESLRRETTITITTVNRSEYQSQVPAAARRALGGPVSSGSAYLIGEKGPEMFFPGVSGSILPNNAISKLPAAGGGSPVVVNVNVGGSVVSQADLVTVVRDGLAQGMRRRGLDPSVLGV